MLRAMPELPEVEIARRNLSRWLVGRSIVRAHVGDPRILGDAEGAAAFAKGLAGKRIRAVERRGKWLKIQLDAGALFSHLGMTGKWVARAMADPSTKSERLRLDLEQRSRATSVRYLDPRLFGRLVVRRPSQGDLPEYARLGPDPLLDGIDVARLTELLKRRRRSIKEVLLDQEVLAGVGNIQATEALFLARVDPHRRADALSAREAKALARGIERSIRDTIAREAGPEITYVEERGAPNPFAIYGRGGQPCPRCKTRLVRTVLGGRGTVHCPHCQR